MESFNAVTAKLEATHDSLRNEVARLTRELGEANAALERSRRLAALGEMAAGIAHEVRNPLGGIQLYARILQQDLESMPPQKRVAEKIAAAALALDGIVGDVLTFSREFRVRKERAAVQDLVERAVEACRHDGVPGWAHVRIQLDVPEGLLVDVDAGLVNQALTNIVRNAFESMVQVAGRAHVLEIGARAACESRSTGEKCVTIWIRDTGTGVSEDVMKRMFNPFFTTRAAGTGLGLSIVHRIVEAHSGRVMLRNREDGTGAIAEMVLPEVTEDVPQSSI
jgi:signal transduction histidine kinase